MSYEYHLAFWFWSGLALASMGAPFLADAVRRLAARIDTHAHGLRAATPLMSLHSSPRPSSPGW